MTYDEFLTRFKVSKRSGNKAQCICPAHNDREASLTITRDNGKILIHCHAGCSTEAILEAVGLQMKDLFDDDQPSESSERWRSYVEGREGRTIEDVYHYYDLTGKYAFTRLRLSGKKFLYGILDADRFSYGLNGRSRKDIPAVYCNGFKRLQTAIRDGRKIFFAEGEKDVKTLENKGLIGVTCGASGDWVPTCTTLFEGADVVILADNDDPGRKSAERIALDLRGIAKLIRVVVPMPDTPKADVTDFFESGHTVQDLETLIEAAKPIQATGEAVPMVPRQPDLDRFHTMSEKGNATGIFDFEIFTYLKETQNILVIGGIVYLYENGVFRPDPSGAKLKTMIRNLIYPEFIKSTAIKRIFDLFLQDSEIQAKPGEMNRFPVEWVCFKNGFYDPVNKKMIPSDPRYRATNQIPHDFDPERGLSGSEIQEWLLSICSKPDDLAMLTQFCGLCLNRDTRQQKFLILHGQGGSGKSTLIRMIEKMIGTDNISNISLNQLTQRFAAYGLMGKLLNTCADLEIDALQDTSTLKKILGEDSISAEAKGKDAVSFKSFAKLVFSTNELPIVVNEKTNGFYRRLLILTMDTVPAAKDPNFFDGLSAHIDDFITIAVWGLESLYETGIITESEASKEAVKRLRCDSDTVEAFLDAKISRNPDEKIKKTDLYRSYVSFCMELERQSLTKQSFYRSMKIKGYAEYRTGGVDYYRGISFP